MNLKFKTEIALCFLTIITCCLTQKAEKLTGQNPCVGIESCGACIQTKSCAWCTQPDYNRPRCFQPAFQSDKACGEKFTYNPDSRTDYLKDVELSKGHKAASEISSSDAFSSAANSQANIVQVKPQRVKLDLRINEVKTIDVQYSQAVDYPVDLYYLMDLSKSMEDDKDNLSKLGNQLATAMTNITSNFRLGFGSFVDKVVMPYVSTVPKNLKEPCTKCAAPYGFRNVMSLSTDTASFSGQVRRAAVSGNLDAPEGGFDAIMQAVVCRSQIGWRDQARRLLVFSTDAGFHYAGDGKLGGIVEPNDGNCHLDPYGDYTHSTVQDYPSISQINLKVKQNAINVIFAVTADHINVYKSLRDHIEGSSCGVLSGDSSNVVKLVEDQYNLISSSVEMKDNSTSSVKITYYSTCLDGPLKATNKCDGLKVGDVVTFSAEIVVTQCPQDPREWQQVIQIYPVGINESMAVELRMLCDCPCEKDSDPSYEENSERCHNAGTYKCGVCACNDQHFGRECECSQTSHQGVSTDTCRPANSTKDVPECSGRGNCVCGQCECELRAKPDELISGAHCECDNFSCDRHNGLLCSGPTNGECRCGQCHCNPGWSGKSCDCRATNDTCTPPGSTEVCSGHGECVCGQCDCGVDNNGSRYSGKFCDKCPTCPGRCTEFKNCVQCKVYKTGPLAESADCANCTFEPIQVAVATVENEKEEYLCWFYDEDDCRYAYVYYYDAKDSVVIRAQQTRDCPPQVFVVGIVLGVIAAIVLIGLALLMVWKMITTIHDRREFARFEKERMLAKWDTGENPIYKQATSTFKNPTYAGK